MSEEEKREELIQKYHKQLAKLEEDNLEILRKLEQQTGQKGILIYPIMLSKDKKYFLGKITGKDAPLRIYHSDILGPEVCENWNGAYFEMTPKE